MKLLPRILPLSNDQRRAKLMSDLIHEEAKIGGQLFGPVPQGHHRQFFCLDEYTWVWHEEWTENGQRQVMTTRYTVHPGGVLKSQGDGRYLPVSMDEARNLFKATQLYQRRIDAKYDRMLQAT
ncbi:MAG: hypothetical protein JWL89_317 [Candidatus Saccharibacteria bacterium]|nr:hypothetical protein [Candidatus Saccharibacteria bacterium]